MEPLAPPSAHTDDKPMGRTRRSLTDLLTSGTVHGSWVPVRLMLAEGSSRFEVQRWLPEHQDLRLGMVLALPDLGLGEDGVALRWTVLEIGHPTKARPVGEYERQPIVALPTAVAALPILVVPAPATDLVIARLPSPTSMPQTRLALSRSATDIRLHNQRVSRAHKDRTPEAQQAWRDKVRAGMERRVAAGLPVGQQTPEQAEQRRLEREAEAAGRYVPLTLERV